MSQKLNKSECAAAIAHLIAPNDPDEQARLKRHHMSRSIEQVRESLNRQRAIAATTKREIHLHCQVSGLPRFERKTR